MQKWDYREMRVCHNGRWADDKGNVSRVPPVPLRGEGMQGGGASMHVFTPALREWGNDGWELVAALPERDTYRFVFKRPQHESRAIPPAEVPGGPTLAEQRG